MALAVLSLYDTPWIDKVWGLKDMEFINTEKGVPLVKKVYVSKLFHPTPSLPQQSNSKKKNLVKNEMVFALGVALIELAYGQPILCYKTTDDLDDAGNETDMTKSFIAQRLEPDIDQRESPNYVQALVRCVRCDFGIFECSFSNKEFREKFYQGVVAPLWRDYESLHKPCPY